MKEIKDRTISLLYRYVRRREARMAPRGAWPDTDYLFVREGVAYSKIPVQLSTIHATSPRDMDIVDIFGEAFWSLEDKTKPPERRYWKCTILWIWATIDSTDEGQDFWKRFQKSAGLSEETLNSILLDLQDAAHARGLV